MVKKSKIPVYDKNQRLEIGVAVVNQWGRDGNLGNASQATSLVIPVIIAFVLGITGGYGASRYWSGSPSSEISKRDSQISVLEKTVSDLRLKDKAPTDATTSSVEIEDLRRQGKDAAREIDALNKTLEEAGDLHASLEKATKSLKLADLEGSALKKTLQERDLAIAKLETELGERVSNADAASAAHVKSLLRENLRLTGQIAADEKERGKLAEKIEALESTKAALNTTIRNLESNFSVVAAQNTALKAQVDALMLAARTGNTTSEPQKPSSNTTKARSSNDVERALTQMPGLDRLSPDRKDILKAKLIDGACVTDALASVFDRVPVLSLRNLIRDLKSPC